MSYVGNYFNTLDAFSKMDTKQAMELQIGALNATIESLEELKKIRFYLECIARKTEAIRYCPNCKKPQMNNGGVFCSECGQKIEQL